MFGFGSVLTWFVVVVACLIVWAFVFHTPGKSIKSSKPSRKEDTEKGALQGIEIVQPRSKMEHVCACVFMCMCAVCCVCVCEERKTGQGRRTGAKEKKRKHKQQANTNHKQSKAKQREAV